MGVVRGRQAGAYVEELADSRFGGQVANDAGLQGTGCPGRRAYARVQLRDLVTDLTVDLIVVLAAQPVVPDPGLMRDRDIDLVQWLLARPGMVAGHRETPRYRLTESASPNLTYCADG